MQWTTADEQNVSHFEVEQSADGVRYFAALSITAKGRSENNYSVTLPIPPWGVRGLYYRLKMIDIDGQYSYSPVVLLSASCQSKKINVYPNPVKDRVYIQGLQVADRYRLVNGNGQIILTGTAMASSVEINTSSLAAGLYILHIVGKEGSSEQIKIVKE